jgi:hypothetical protein
MLKTSRRNDSITCAHPGLEYLGDNRDARFFHCEHCNQVFVVQSGQTWSIPALPARDKMPLAG